MCAPVRKLWPMSTNILEMRNWRRRWWSSELKGEYMSLTCLISLDSVNGCRQNDKKVALVDPQTMRSCFMPTIQAHCQLDHVVLAAPFFLYSPGICVSGVFYATGSCVNLRHAFLLFAAARLMWWPREPCSDCLTQLSASWLWAEPSCENVYQILLSHTLCVHAAACIGHSLLSIPTVNSLVIYWCFRMFLDGGGSILNMQPTCWQEDVERCQVFFVFLHGANSSPSLPDFYLRFMLFTWTSTLP